MLTPADYTEQMEMSRPRGRTKADHLLINQLMDRIALLERCRVVTVQKLYKMEGRDRHLICLGCKTAESSHVHLSSGKWVYARLGQRLVVLDDVVLMVLPETPG